VANLLQKNRTLHSPHIVDRNKSGGWHCGSALVSINMVAVRHVLHTSLILGWMAVHEFESCLHHVVFNHRCRLTQPRHPAVVDKMTTGISMPHTAVATYPWGR